MLFRCSFSDQECPERRDSGVTVKANLLGELVGKDVMRQQNVSEREEHEENNWRKAVQHRDCNMLWQL